MSEYKDRFDKWQRDAKEKFDEIDKQLGIKERIEEGARVVAETAHKGAELIISEAERSDVGKTAVKAAEETIKTAESTAKKAWTASGPLRDAAEDAGHFAEDFAKQAGKAASEVIGSAGKNAGDFIGDARDSVEKNAKRVSQAFNFGASWTRTIDSAMSTFSQAATWVQNDPVGAATTGASIAVGAGLGAVFTGISSHWFFNSGLPAWSVKTLGEQFNTYLKEQEAILAAGDVDLAKAERVRFERDIVKKIGAPLLGGFAFASGAVMMTNVLNPKEVTGAPISWLLGGNPMLEGVWFFGNGLVCFRTSYDFFMIALDGQDDVERMVREIKGLLPGT